MNRIRKGCTLSFRWEVSKNGHPHSFWTVEDFIRAILSSSVATSQLLYFRRFFTKIQHAISSQIKLLGNCNLMHQNKGTEMVKTSVYMRKDDFEKVQQFSDDISWNLFMRRAIRRAIEEEEEKRLKGVVSSQSSPAATSTTDRGLMP